MGHRGVVNVALRVHRLRTRLAWERTFTCALRACAIAAPLWVAGTVGAGLRVGVLELLGAGIIGAIWGWRGAPDDLATARRIDALLGLQDRVLTAWTTRDDSSAMAALARRDAAAAWSAAPVGPLVARWPWGLAALVVLVLLGASVWRVTMPGGVEGVVTTRRVPDPSPVEGAAKTVPAGEVPRSPVASPGEGAGEGAGVRAVPAEAGAGVLPPAGSPSTDSAAAPKGVRGRAGLRLGAAGLDGAPVSGGTGPSSASEVAAARRATPQLPERYRAVVLRYLAERRP